MSSIPKFKSIYSKEDVFDKNVCFINNTNISHGLEKAFSQSTILDNVDSLNQFNNKDCASMPDALIYSTDHIDISFLNNISQCKSHLTHCAVPIIVLTKNISEETKKTILQAGADDCFTSEIDVERLNYWINFLKIFKQMSSSTEENVVSFDDKEFKLPFGKRIFDIVFSLLTITALSPLFILISVAIKLESKGSIFYISKRAGTGYRVINFLKFRSMQQHADKEIENLKHLNQYADSNSEDPKSPMFIKIKDDPRVTRFGKFLRMTSIDELPQLINVLKGDMSIVGNRPLPLYEAQQLTRDQYAMRFNAPAGITGLWQVTKRGHSNMSNDDRILLDVEYASKYSFWYDLNIIIRTIPAILQKEKV